LIEKLGVLTALDMTPEDAEIIHSRGTSAGGARMYRMRLGDRVDSALMFALTDATNDKSKNNKHLMP